jgi:antitoxin ParD1/3/4
MSSAQKISITLPPEMNRIIKERVDAGDYGSTSELIREALRLWQRREEQHKQGLADIRSRIDAALADPRPSLSMDEARAEFRAHVISKLDSAA